MNLDSFYQTSVYFCLCLIALNLAFAFVIGLGVFGTITPSGFVSSDTPGTVSDITGLEAETDDGSVYTGADALWVIASGSAIGGIAGFFLAWATKTSVFMAIGLFSGTFWSSYYNSLSILDAGGYLSILSGFTLIATVLIVFVFMGAVIGMLGGTN